MFASDGAGSAAGGGCALPAGVHTVADAHLLVLHESTGTSLEIDPSQMPAGSVLGVAFDKTPAGPAVAFGLFSGNPGDCLAPMLTVTSSAR